MYFVHRKGNIEKFSFDEIFILRASKNNYDLWIDLEQRQIIEKQKGVIDLFHKKVLGKLLCFLIMNGNKKFTPEELYPPVWCLNISDFSEEKTVKTSISRLRKMLESDSSNWKYIKKTEPSFLGRRGEYYFNTESNYSLIQPKKFELF